MSQVGWDFIWVRAVGGERRLVNKALICFISPLLSGCRLHFAVAETPNHLTLDIEDTIESTAVQWGLPINPGV